MRDVMTEIGRSKGLDLDWYAVTHTNTEHIHSHVVVMPIDRWGRQVRFNKSDYENMRVAGDRYLFRYRILEREKLKVKEKQEEQKLSWLDKLKRNAKRIYEELKSLVSNEEEAFSAPYFDRKQNERNAFGNVPSYEGLLVLRQERKAKQKKRDWKKYIRPIQISYVPSVEPILYNPCTPLSSLRKLENEYLKGESCRSFADESA